ncbi:NAD(P)-dependent oxidoreductase [Salininema proteolyticum]|uniref:NAD(P)-dependent oxidoreductase n=1 Tax=Salininema proteolyticum TaxID=1607685 RepID=A0ABV8U3X3_9ACTN
MENNDIPATTLIGLGPVGRAAARTLLAHGHRVTLWNRTAAKAEPFRDEATIASDPAEAVSANGTVLLCLTDHEALYDVLGPVERLLAEKTVVNLSSGTPPQAREAARWVAGRGGDYLSGAFMSVGDDLSHPLSHVLFSGRRDVFERHAALLSPLGPRHYFGEDPGLAQVYNQALLSVVHPFALAVEQSAATFEGWGVPAEDFVPHLERLTDVLKAFVPVLATTSEDVNAELAPDRMMEASARHAADTSAEVGVDAFLVRAVRDHYAARAA